MSALRRFRTELAYRPARPRPSGDLDGARWTEGFVLVRKNGSLAWPRWPNPFPGTAYGTSSGSWNVPDAPTQTRRRQHLLRAVEFVLADQFRADCEIIDHLWDVLDVRN